MSCEVRVGGVEQSAEQLAAVVRTYLCKDITGLGSVRMAALLVNRISKLVMFMPELTSLRDSH